MNCPVCKIEELNPVELEGDLQAFECPKCKGNFIPYFNYQKFLENRTLNMDIIDKVKFNKVFNNKDDDTLKNCPECGKVLIARKAGFGLEFYIEKCEHCSGIWLDNNEWNFLKESNLENNIYYIFSSSWQNYVHKQEVREIKINNIKKYFSDEQSEKIIDFLDWLDNQENKREIQTYIISN